ncbi:MAG: transcriptional repressor [Proteobacteria bacterium]|nr:transcriptional repressor [Pseudomonadota bacterium]
MVFSSSDFRLVLFCGLTTLFSKNAGIDESVERTESGVMAKSPPCGRKRNQDFEPETGVSAQNWRTTLNQFLKSRGLRATRPRELVASIALARKSHFEIQTLVKEVRSRHPEISPATVYRSVKTLCEAGLLIETLQGNARVALYELAADDHHDHLVCLDCGEIFEFHDPAMERAQTRAVESMSFKEVRHRHVVYARCNELKQRS